VTRKAQSLQVGVPVVPAVSKHDLVVDIEQRHFVFGPSEPVTAQANPCWINSLLLVKSEVTCVLAISHTWPRFKIAANKYLPPYVKQSSHG